MAQNMSQNRTALGQWSVARALTSLEQIIAVSRSRRALAALDPAQLADVGISQPDAQTEAALPFWDVPSNWRCTR
ncbi:MAG: DUF1127 domain-containing protein [Pseudomonadota bacterium]